MRTMRRIERLMSSEESAALLTKGEYGDLCTVDAEGQPSGTPMSYIFYEGDIYFHSAVEGLKLDNIKSNPKVCFTVVKHSCMDEEELVLHYESVMAYGKASLVDDEDKIIKILMEHIKKYSSDFNSKWEGYIKAAIKDIVIIKMEVDLITGKRS